MAIELKQVLVYHNLKTTLNQPFARPTSSLVVGELSNKTHMSEPLLSNSTDRDGPREQTAITTRCHRLRGLMPSLISMNVLLVFVPIGFLAAGLSWNDVVVSAFNFLAIIPLSALISDASDTIGNRWGGLVGGLVNASFGNTVELIVGAPSIHNCNADFA